MELVKIEKAKVRTVDFIVHFDNGGGATLVVECKKYAHYYDDMKQLAMDYSRIISGSDVGDWDGNEYIEQATNNYKAQYGYRSYEKSQIRSELDMMSVFVGNFNYYEELYLSCGNVASFFEWFYCGN